QVLGEYKRIASIATESRLPAIGAADVRGPPCPSRRHFRRPHRAPSTSSPQSRAQRASRNAQPRPVRRRHRGMAEGARPDRRRRATGDHAPIDTAPAGEARTQARVVFDSVRGLAAAAAARLTAALSCWRRRWANSPNVPRKSRAFSKCARTENCPSLAFSKRNLASVTHASAALRVVQAVV